ncbi:MAG TPA: hypothetical protein VE733_18635 [Streptosporangiaceae bacterium]|jgi:cbb3-type cytochrome oxidase subunit 3|nr:hypothetical protein [Streptosporangiaceae bacterium]
MGAARTGFTWRCCVLALPFTAGEIFAAFVIVFWMISVYWVVKHILRPSRKERRQMRQAAHAMNGIFAAVASGALLPSEVDGFAARIGPQQDHRPAFACDGPPSPHQDRYVR